MSHLITPFLFINLLDESGQQVPNTSVKFDEDVKSIVKVEGKNPIYVTPSLSLNDKSSSMTVGNKYQLLCYYALSDRMSAQYFKLEK